MCLSEQHPTRRRRAGLPTECDVAASWDILGCLLAIAIAALALTAGLVWAIASWW